MREGVAWLALIAAVILFSSSPGLAQENLKTPPPSVVQPESAPVGPAINPEAAPVNVVPAPAEQGLNIPGAKPAPADPATLPRNLSPLGMFIAADWVVKSVLIGLIIASVTTWTIWLVKFFELGGARVRALRTLKHIATAKSLEEAEQNLSGRRGPAASMVFEARHETELSSEMIVHAGGEGLKERVSSSLSRIEAAAVRRISKGTGLLATIGSTAPFIGLFGTVWGIMNAFIGISEAKTTNLAVVAPGIAEALLATAAGLVAAIPAVIIYNIFARSIAGYRQLLGDAAAGVERLISRDLDMQRAEKKKGARSAKTPAAA